VKKNLATQPGNCQLVLLCSSRASMLDVIKLSKEDGVTAERARESIRRVLNNALGMSAYKRHRILGLTNAAVVKRLERSKMILAGDEIIFFR
jgi:hypothetical protein